MRRSANHVNPRTDALGPFFCFVERADTPTTDSSRNRASSFSSNNRGNAIILDRRLLRDRWSRSPYDRRIYARCLRCKQFVSTLQAWLVPIELCEKISAFPWARLRRARLCGTASLSRAVLNEDDVSFRPVDSARCFCDDLRNRPIQNNCESTTL